MSSSTIAVLDEPGTAKTVSLRVDITVLGYIATWYANGGGSDQPMPGWGAGLRQSGIRTKDGSLWTASLLTQDWNGKPTVGVFVMRHYDAFNGGKKKATWWFPLSALKTVVCMMSGYQFPVFDPEAEQPEEE
jgi:hypothetical protein